MVVVSAAGTEEGLVCNPEWNIIDQVNLVNNEGAFSEFQFQEVVSFGDGYVVPLRFAGFFQDTFGPAGFVFDNPSQASRPDSINFEGVQMWGEAAGSFNYEIQEYWSYGGTYDTRTGAKL